MIPIHMVPAYTTPVGLTFCQGLLPSLQEVSKNIAAATERGADRDGRMQFHTNPRLLNGEIFEKSACVIREARETLRMVRQNKTPITKYEFEFFRSLIKGSTAALESLARSVERESKSQSPWFSTEAKAGQRGKAWIDFAANPPVAAFFGLDLPDVVTAAFRTAGLKLTPGYDRRTVDRVGIGLAAALRVYSGEDSLVVSRRTFLPHRAFRVEDLQSPRRGDKTTRRIYVTGSAWLPVLYPG
ncbi:MAG TPA: hypothetical protein VFX30_02690 [bacterium]|nr:hypothetical protein [bacterium]